MSAVHRVSCVAIAGLLLAGACSGGGGSSSSPSAPSSAAAASSSLPLGPGQTLHTVNATFESGGFLVTIGNTVYDDNEGEMLLGVRFRNLGEGWSSPELSATLEIDGLERSMIAERPVDVPPGRSIDVTLSIPVLDRDPTADGVLGWGRPDRDQPRIHLSDGNVDGGFIPNSFELDGRAHIGKYAVHLTGGRLQSGQIYRNVQADPGQRILRMSFEVFANRLDPVNGFSPIQHLTLVRPDGQTVEGVDSSEGFLPLSWTTTANNWIEFPVASDPTGDYQLLLSSLDPLGFSTLHPELVERVSIPFHLDAIEPGTAPDEPLPNPELPGSEQANPDALDVDLDVGTVNVPGFTFRPTHLRWDPEGQIVRVDGEATYLQTESNPDTGVLAITPQFSFTHLLVTRGTTFNGVIEGNVDVTAGSPKMLTIEFESVDRFDLNDAGLMMGPRAAQASSIPLGRSSDLPRYPPAPDEQAISVGPVTAGAWTVQLVSYRVGLLQTTGTPPPGQRDLEITMDVTAAPDAFVPILGLSFRPAAQLFLSGADGYMSQGRGDSGLVLFNPGETYRQSVTFYVSDSFSPGRVGFVLRGGDEVTDIHLDNFVETTFGADLGVAPAVAAGTS